MKVIDLLNKIANGEEVPKKILYVGDNYFWNKSIKFYYTQEGMSLYREMLTEGNCLDDEVEIIEDEFIDIEEINYEKLGSLTANESVFLKRINDLIKNQKAIINKIKDSE